jgi:ABC-type multidrug transport system ATPase subunit
VWDVLEQLNTAPMEVRDLRVSYGPTRAVDGVSLEVRAGEVFGLLGPNGAGKTTTLSAIEGVSTLATGSSSSRLSRRIRFARARMCPVGWRRAIRKAGIPATVQR